jgi:hypothetical protein
MPRLFTEGVEPKALPGKVVSEDDAHAEGCRPGELLEEALKDLSAVKSKSKRLDSAVKRVKEVKDWVEARVGTEAKAVVS